MVGEFYGKIGGGLDLMDLLLDQNPAKYLWRTSEQPTECATLDGNIHQAVLFDGAH